MGKWMSFAKAVARAGSLEDLLVRMRDMQVASRAADFFMNGNSTKRADRNIPHDWWAEDVAHDINPAAGRAVFRLNAGIEGANFDEVAIGIEIEGAAVDALWLAKQKPSGGKRGKKPYPFWAKVQLHFDNLVSREGPFPSLGSARESVKLWLKGKRLVQPDDRTSLAVDQ